jgi:hypothetical protein
MTLEEFLKFIKTKEGKEALNGIIEEHTDALKQKNDELLKEKKKAKEEAKLAADKLKEIEDAKEEEESEKNKKKGDWETEKAKLVEKHTKELKDRDDKLAATNGKLNNLVVDNGLNDALIKANVAKQYLPAVKALIKTANKIEISTDDETPIAKVGDKDLTAFIETWAKGDEGKQYIAAPNNSGGGARGSNSNASGKTEYDAGLSPAAKIAAGRASSKA